MIVIRHAKDTEPSNKHSHLGSTEIELMSLVDEQVLSNMAAALAEMVTETVGVSARAMRMTLRRSVLEWHRHDRC